MGLGRNRVDRTGETCLYIALALGEKSLAVGLCTAEIQFLMRYRAKHFVDAIEQLEVAHLYG